jgi:hypothetical protein
MQRRTQYLVGGGLLAAALAAGTGIAIAAGEDENEGPDVPISGGDLERASTAALEHTGGGRVTDTEVGDEESYYEVEVTLDDGTQVDVQLDERFQVVGRESDGNDDDDD